MIFGRPNPDYWTVWMRVAGWLPKRLLYGALVHLALIVARRRGVPATSAVDFTVQDIARDVFTEWGW